MTGIRQGLIQAWNRNAEYGQKLVADLSDAQMIAQPEWLAGPPMNHPAWILSHLNVYLPVIAAIVENRDFDDPKGHQFGMHSAPQMVAGVYAAKSELMGTFAAGHARVRDSLESATDSVFDNPVRLPRWQPLFGSAAILLPYLMLNHENGHLGQLSAWRRAMGLAPV